MLLPKEWSCSQRRGLLSKNKGISSHIPDVLSTVADQLESGEMITYIDSLHLQDFNLEH